MAQPKKGLPVGKPKAKVAAAKAVTAAPIQRPVWKKLGRPRRIVAPTVNYRLLHRLKKLSLASEETAKRSSGVDRKSFGEITEKHLAARKRMMTTGGARYLGETQVFGPRSYSLERQPPPKGKITAGPPNVGLSDCSYNFAKALCNSFGTFEDLPWIPSDPPAETQKWRNLTRVSFVTGLTTGIGFIQIAPLNPANNSLSISVSVSATTAVGFARPGVAGAVGVSRPALPYAINRFNTVNDYLSARLVGLSMRVKNTTPALAVGGYLIGCRLPPGEDLSTVFPAGVQSVLESPLACADAITLDRQGEWRQLSWVPGDPSDLSFPEASTDYTITAGGDVNMMNLGFAVQCATGAENQQTWLAEIMEFWEFTGEQSGTTLPEVTRSEADGVGLDRVLSAAVCLPTTMTVEEAVDTMASNIVDSMAHSDSVAKTVEDLTGMAGLSLGPVEKLVDSLIGALIL